MSDYFATPEERHEVAERLRKHFPLYRDKDIYQAVFGRPPIEMMISERKQMIERLADLIDPTCSIGYTDLTTDTPDGYDPDGYYYCSRCGELDGPFDEIWDTYQARYYEGEPPFRYCPHCGSRVVIPSV